VTEKLTAIAEERQRVRLYPPPFAVVPSHACSIRERLPLGDRVTPRGQIARTIVRMKKRLPGASLHFREALTKEVEILPVDELTIPFRVVIPDQRWRSVSERPKSPLAEDERFLGELASGDIGDGAKILRDVPADILQGHSRARHPGDSAVWCLKPVFRRELPTTLRRVVPCGNDSRAIVEDRISKRAETFVRLYILDDDRLRRARVARPWRVPFDRSAVHFRQSTRRGESHHVVSIEQEDRSARATRTAKERVECEMERRAKCRR
jgi:hypothetical protein